MAALVLLAACGPHAAPADNRAQARLADPTPIADPAPTPAAANLAEAAPLAPLSCEAEIGARSAQTLADICRNVSPATHPPCNIANSCAMIADEVARGCALIGDGADRPADCGPAAASPAAAVEVIRLYYRALAARDFATAYSQWGNDGAASGKSYDAFAAGFAKTRTTRVTTGTPGEGDGAAGSIFVTIPVTVTAALTDGTQQHFTGSYTLRRVNDVPGASADQLRWHIASATPKRSK